MRIPLLSITLFFAAISLLHAAPEVVEIQDFDPPVNWQTDSRLSQKAWWKPLLLAVAPEKFAIAAWRRHHSQKVQESSDMDEPRFKLFGDGIRKRREDGGFRNEIVRTVSIKDGNTEYLKVVEKVSDGSAPDSGGIYRSIFLKKEGENWINWVPGIDFASDSPLLRMGDEKPLPDSGK